MELPQDKADDLKTSLINSLNKSKWAKRYTQHITGKLSWATQFLSQETLTQHVSSEEVLAWHQIDGSYEGRHYLVVGVHRYI